jgi:hypothetical protein
VRGGCCKRDKETDKGKESHKEAQRGNNIRKKNEQRVGKGKRRKDGIHTEWN